MRIILFPNGAVVNNNLKINLIPGKEIESHITIPGYVAGTLTAITSLAYDYTVDAGVIHIRMYVPQNYGASGEAELSLAYATTSIHGNVYYIYDVESGSITRSVSITNNSGTAFESDIGIAVPTTEDEIVPLDIHEARQVSYVQVGNLIVNEGTQMYQLPSSMQEIEIFFNVDIKNSRVWMYIHISVDGGSPAPGILVISDPVFHTQIYIEDSYTITDVQQDAVFLDGNILHVSIPSHIVLSGVISANIEGPEGMVSYQVDQSNIMMDLSIGMYSITNIIYG